MTLTISPSSNVVSCIYLAFFERSVIGAVRSRFINSFTRWRDITQTLSKQTKLTLTVTLTLTDTITLTLTLLNPKIYAHFVETR